jgi:hypothetical protein
LQPPWTRVLAGCLRSLRQCHRSLESDRRHGGERRSWSIEQSASSYSSQLRPAVSEAASPPLVSQRVHRTVSPSRGSAIPRTSLLSRLRASREAESATTTRRPRRPPRERASSKTRPRGGVALSLAGPATGRPLSGPASSAVRVRAPRRLRPQPGAGRGRRRGRRPCARRLNSNNLTPSPERSPSPRAPSAPARQA